MLGYFPSTFLILLRVETYSFKFILWTWKWYLSPVSEGIQIISLLFLIGEELHLILYATVAYLLGKIGSGYYCIWVILDELLYLQDLSLEFVPVLKQKTPPTDVGGGLTVFFWTFAI